MRFIPSNEGPQVAGRKPTVYQGSHQAEIDALVAEALERGVDTVDHPDLELSGGELYAEHSGNVSFLPSADRRKGERRTVTHPADGELWGPAAKLGDLAAVAGELDALGLHRLAWRIRKAIGAAA